MNPAIWWIRRDMRLADNGALQSAARAGEVVPVFVWDGVLLATAAPARRQFMGKTLESLDAALGGLLVHRVGDPATEVNAVCDLVGADSVHVAADFAPYGRRRDAAVAATLTKAGRTLVLADTPYVVAPGTVRKDDGTPLKVFTPFYKRWLTHRWSHVNDGPVNFVDATAHRAAPPDLPSTDVVLPSAGETAAWDRFHSWRNEGMETYKMDRDNPGIDGTSLMSPYLKFGVVHPRQLLAHAGPSAGAEHFRSEIAWREFYADVLFHQPDTAWRNLQRKMDAMVVDSDDAARRRFDQFCRAETGYPVVDAGIRQMLGTGWMHNRVRMIVASFLVKDLHLPWQWGAKFFMEHLVDADIASNNHGWQWTAGTGTDAAPYFRVFNPFGQSEKFDPTGAYIRRWVPEIAHLDDKHIHAPWTLGLMAPPDYPAPMVDHAVEREEALLRYKSASGK